MPPTRINWYGIIIAVITITSSLIFAAFTTFETKDNSKEKYVNIVMRLNKVEELQIKIYNILLKAANHD